MNKIRMAQYGTKHGHAAGKLEALRKNREVEFVGVFEPDGERRRVLEQSDNPFRGMHWFDSMDEMLGDPTIVAIASEGRNDESLDQTEEIVQAGKHVWYDKPAGDNWEQWRRVVALAEANGLRVQMGYMFRYHDGFRRIAGWAHSGLLGEVFAVRAHMSTWISEAARQVVSRHTGGIFYDLASHMLDQIVWLLGRPVKVTSFLRNDSGLVPAFKDNTLGVFEYEHAIAFVDIAAMEVGPVARRFEVYGSQGSAILLEPFEPGTQIRLCLREVSGEYTQGEQFLPVEGRPRQRLYELELEAFLASILGKRQPNRPLTHELLVQETLLRATGMLPDR
ncbi:MAG: Gfo/Idh/MocA family oxidoreductase [Candidatus Latescibacteria bacterium]|nr:Gfo/Idh/MocA family oxidoreductase [Candidatus Latescibacterota bacterium]